MHFSFSERNILSDAHDTHRSKMYLVISSILKTQLLLSNLKKVGG